MHVDRLSDGLWRWTAPHPDWRDEPAVGWERDVACVYHEATDGILLLDPLVPSGDEGERFWRHLDQDVERVGLPPQAPPIMMFLDPPQHTEVRRPATRTFTQRRVAALRDEVETQVTDSSGEDQNSD